MGGKRKSVRHGTDTSMREELYASTGGIWLRVFVADARLGPARQPSGSLVNTLYRTVNCDLSCGESVPTDSLSQEEREDSHMAIQDGFPRVRAVAPDLLVVLRRPEAP